MANNQSNATAIFNRWLSLVLSLLLIGFFAFVIVPILCQLPFVAEHIQILKDRDTRAGAYFYTDVNEVGQAESFLRNAKAYGPKEK